MNAVPQLPAHMQFQFTTFCGTHDLIENVESYYAWVDSLNGNATYHELYASGLAPDAVLAGVA